LLPIPFYSFRNFSIAFWSFSLTRFHSTIIKVGFWVCVKAQQREAAAKDCGLSQVKFRSMHSMTSFFVSLCCYRLLFSLMDVPFLAFVICNCKGSLFCANRSRKRVISNKPSTHCLPQQQQQPTR